MVILTSCQGVFPALFDHPAECVSCKEVTLKKFCPSVALLLRTLMNSLVNGKANMLGKESYCSNLTIQAFSLFFMSSKLSRFPQVLCHISIDLQVF